MSNVHSLSIDFAYRGHQHEAIGLIRSSSKWMDFIRGSKLTCHLKRELGKESDSQHTDFLGDHRLVIWTPKIKKHRDTSPESGGYFFRVLFTLELLWDLTFTMAMHAPLLELPKGAILSRFFCYYTHAAWIHLPRGIYVLDGEHLKFKKTKGKIKMENQVQP
jgi:hypothetical protein